MRTWFGEFDGKNVTIAGRSIDALAATAASSDSMGTSSGVDLENLALTNGLCHSAEEYRTLLHRVSMQVARNTISTSLAGKDAYLMQAAKTLDDLNDAYNILSERLTEWYGVHYPEQRMRPNELLDFILQYGDKGSSSVADARTSMGAPMDQDDIGAVQGLALTAKALFYQRKAMDGYVEKTMGEVAPNLANVLGPVLGARMIARAGSLEKLAKMPASTIQVMGSGEALFKHLKMGTPSPKHGLIYKHPLISGAPKAARGKISRMLAGKAAIAARVDYYSGEAVDFGDLKEKAAAIKARVRRRKA